MGTQQMGARAPPMDTHVNMGSAPPMVIHAMHTPVASVPVVRPVEAEVDQQAANDETQTPQPAADTAGDTQAPPVTTTAT